MPEQVGPSRASTAGCGLRCCTLWVGSLRCTGTAQPIETCPGWVLQVEPVHLHDGTVPGLESDRFQQYRLGRETEAARRESGTGRGDERPGGTDVVWPRRRPTGPRTRCVSAPPMDFLWARIRHQHPGIVCRCLYGSSKVL